MVFLLYLLRAETPRSFQKQKTKNDSGGILRLSYLHYTQKKGKMQTFCEKNLQNFCRLQ